MAKKRKFKHVAPHTEDIVEDFVPELPRTSQATPFGATVAEDGMDYLPQSSFVGQPSKSFANHMSQALGVGDDGYTPVSPGERSNPGQSPVADYEKGNKDGKKGKGKKDWGDIITQISDAYAQIYLNKDLGQNAALKASREAEAQQQFQQQQLKQARDDSYAGRAFAAEQAGLGRDHVAGENNKDRDSKKQLEEMQNGYQMARMVAQGDIDKGLLQARNNSARGSSVLDHAVSNGVDMRHLVGVDWDNPDEVARAAATVSNGVRQNLNSAMDREDRAIQQQRDAAVMQQFQADLSGFNIVTDPSGARVRVATGLGSAYEQAMELIKTNFTGLQANDPTVQKELHKRRRQFKERGVQFSVDGNAMLAAETDTTRKKTFEIEQEVAYGEEWDRAFADFQIELNNQKERFTPTTGRETHGFMDKERSAQARRVSKYTSGQR